MTPAVTFLHPSERLRLAPWTRWVHMSHNSRYVKWLVFAALAAASISAWVASGAPASIRASHSGVSRKITRSRASSSSRTSETKAR